MDLLQNAENPELTGVTGRNPATLRYAMMQYPCATVSAHTHVMHVRITEANFSLLVVFRQTMRRKLWYLSCAVRVGVFSSLFLLAESQFALISFPAKLHLGFFIDFKSTICVSFDHLIPFVHGEDVGIGRFG